MSVSCFQRELDIARPVRKAGGWQTVEGSVPGCQAVSFLKPVAIGANRPRCGSRLLCQGCRCLAGYASHVRILNPPDDLNIHLDRGLHNYLRVPVVGHWAWSDLCPGPAQSGPPGPKRLQAQSHTIRPTIMAPLPSQRSTAPCT